MAEFLRTSDITESKAFLRTFIKRIAVKPGRAVIHYTIPMPEDSPIGRRDAAEVALTGGVRSSIRDGGPSVRPLARRAEDQAARPGRERAHAPGPGSPGQAGDVPWGRVVLDRFGPVPEQPALAMDRAYEGGPPPGLRPGRAATPPSGPALALRPPAQPPAQRCGALLLPAQALPAHRHATRHDKLDTLFLAFIHLVAICDALQPM